MSALANRSPTLAEVQQDLGLALLAATPPSELDALYRRIGGADDIHPDARLQVYRDNALGAQRHALQQIYPACQRVLGEDCFRTLGHDYLTEHPSTDPDLNRLGEHFPALLDRVLRVRPAFEPYPYLSDLARLEWGLHRAYLATEPAPFDWAWLQTVPDQPQLRFELQPALGVLTTRWPLPELWRGDEAPCLPDEPLNLCMHRSAPKASFDPVDSALAALIGGIADGLTLGALATAGLPVDRIGELLQRAWIVSASVAPAPNQGPTQAPEPPR